MNSAASIAPLCRAARISPAGSRTAEPQTRLMSAPPRPGMRIFSPRKSCIELISLRHRPKDRAAVCATGKATMPKRALSSSQSACPPPW